MLFVLPFLPALKRQFKAHEPAPKAADPVKTVRRKAQRKARKATRRGKK